MALRQQVPELRCMDPENYKKFFRILCWTGIRKNDRKPQKKLGKKDKLRKLKAASSLVGCFAPALLGNASQFAVFATIRKSVLSRWRQLPGTISELSDDSDNEESSSQAIVGKLPKITGIGLRTVFSLVSQARFTDANFCEHALKALLDVLQGLPPEELAQEPTEIITNLHAMLIEVASGSGPTGRVESPTNLTAMSSSCLIALSVARGEADLMLNAVVSLIISAPTLSEQQLQIPLNLTTFQRSVQAVIIGSPSRNQWMNFGVPQQSLVTSFPVDLPSALTVGAGELVVRSLVSDGCFLYVFTSKGLLKIGSGYGSSIKQHVYMYKPDFFASDRHGWLGYCKNKLYVRIGRKKPEVYEVDKDTLEVRNIVRLDTGQPGPAELKSAVFTDGNHLGLILLTNFERLKIRTYDVESTPERVEGTSTTTLTSHKELSVHLLRRRTLALGRAPYEEALPQRAMDGDAPIAMQFDDDEDDIIISIAGGQDFALLRTATGRVYYTGKACSLGYKAGSSQNGRWTLIKETVITKNDVLNLKKARVVQVAVGHEGVHAIFVMDNGTALFAGVARRGEDGDMSKHRRAPKPSRPKKIFKVEEHHVVYAACNYGSSALVTRQGLLLMLGKDTQHCDSAGIVLGLKHEKVIQVALGKAHAVALTSYGHVYTFGINNKGQCGREFGYAKEKMFSSRRHSGNKEDVRLCQSSHTWTTDYCRVCVLCRECTGFASACHCALLPNRVPGEKCGCGEGDSGCVTCGVCRKCAEALDAAIGPERNDADLDDDADTSTTSDTKSDKENAQYEGQVGSEAERDPSLKVSCLPPARVAVPGGYRIITVACGLHHTVLLTEHGEVLTFGSNQYGQLGAGDISAHHRIVRVRAPRVTSIAAGSNHTVLLTRDGELYTFGNYQKGSLGRNRVEDPARADRSHIWYATPGRVPRVGPRYACKANWISASGDQTIVQVLQSLIKTDTLFSSTITATNNCIIILPNRPEHLFKCITINKNDGTCNAWTGAEQVDFVNTLACLDPLYDVMWCYQPQMRIMKCYNIQAFDCHKLHRCCNEEPEEYSAEPDFKYPNFGTLKRLEDFMNLENFELTSNSEEKPMDTVALSNISVLNQELAIPAVNGCSITRMHAALHLLGCLDSLLIAHETRLGQADSKRDASSPVLAVKEDFLTVNRFESHGGGWGYSGHSVEAIRFMCDTDVLLGGYGLFGGRGDYTAKIKLYDIGLDGGDQEGDGELLAESDEIVFECAPRDRYPVLFESPLTLFANRWYVAWACINGPSSDCGSSGQAMVINDEIGFHFKTSKKSNNGTDVNAGQIPSLLYNLISSDQAIPVRNIDHGEPVLVLSKNISRKVTVPCFKSLITLLQWSWSTLNEKILDTNGQIPINYQKLTLMKHQKRLVYVIRACLRIVKSYINEIYPQNNRQRNSYEYMSYFEAIAEIRNLIQIIMAEATPTCAMLPRKPGKNKAHRVCYVQFALELTNAILKETHDTITSCFHAFFPTPTLKWNHLCSMLYLVKDGVVPGSVIRELTSTCAALCASRSLRDVLLYVVPVTQSFIMKNELRRPDSKIMKDVPSKSATVPRASHTHKPPPVPPRSNNKDGPKPSDSAESKPNYTEWHLLDAVPILLDIVMIPIKQHMMTRQCGQPHDHGEIQQNERLAEYCCKITARIIAELSHSATHIKDSDSNAGKQLVTPTRFMRVNQSRSWNTGNGSPDAICFTVNRPGITLAGVSIFGGLGNFDYSLELLHDVQAQAAPENSNDSHCWMSLEIVHGTFSAEDCQHDMVQIKFERSIPLEEDVRYAIRLCNHGGRTSNGDCGLPSVKGPDGTTFRFSSCTLSFNGTTLARGQIPCLIYQGSAKSSSTNSESTDSLISALRGMTLRVASIVIDRSTELFCTLRNELTAEDLRRNATVLQHSPVINTLIPYTLANLECLDDPKSAIKRLEMVHKLLPHVAAMNLLVPSVEDSGTTTTHYYTWLESDHPYKQATVTNMRVLFPTNVSWIVLEMDSRSVTAQPEDTLTVYAMAGAPSQKCHNINEMKAEHPSLRKVYKRMVQLTSDFGEAEEMSDDSEADSLCMHYNCSYVSVTPKLANIPAEWPQKALLIPGNEVIFSLETASDYLTEYNKSNNEENRYGFRCLCVGYEEAPLTSQRQGLVSLEMELVYAGAGCASRLLAPDLNIPPLSFATLLEVQVQSMMGISSSGPDEETSHDDIESLLLARGLELPSPPSIHNVLDGQPLLRSVSTERQFLTDFVAGAESTAGGRLARWLGPMSHVEPANCELKAPPTPPVRLSARVPLLILVRDQYGDLVSSPALKVEVVAQRLEKIISRRSQLPLPDVRHGSLTATPYSTTVRDTMCFHAITMMKAYEQFSFEELRHLSGGWGETCVSRPGIIGRVPAERLTVRAQPDGSYVATWIPRAPGTYQFRCTLDDQPTPHELTIDAEEQHRKGSSDGAQHTDGTRALSPPSKLRRFTAKYSAGLRIRASPSLQSEELGHVPPGGNIAFVEEVVNKDGTWVRLDAESARAYADGCVEIAWCLQHNRHLDHVMLMPIECSSPTQSDCAGATSDYEDQGADLQSWAQDEESETGTSDIGGTEYSQHPFSIQFEAADEGNSSSSPFVDGVEPSKRSRILRKEIYGQSPKRVLRRSNGNSDDWWTAMKQRISDNLDRDVNSIQETEIEPVPEAKPDHIVGSRLAQAGTQTSPDSVADDTTSAIQVCIGSVKDGRLSPKSVARERIATRSRAYKRPGSPPPLPARKAPAPPAPKKTALSPAQTESLRAIFAALMWHEGIVPDAIACAAFLKFHPLLPKQGARVVTRPPHDITPPRHQRHSVEVSNAGHYLRIHPTTLETLTRSGVEASTSRTRKTDIDVPIKEEDALGHSSKAGPSSSEVNVLPPALRALVALWDALYDSNQLSAATNKNKKEFTEKKENDEPMHLTGGIRKKRDLKTSAVYKTPYSIWCELCDRASVPPPLALHMRRAHPGCRAPSTHGYDRSGCYKQTDPPPMPDDAPAPACGQLAQAYQMWYIFCEKCRDEAMKTTTSVKQLKSKTISEIGPETASHPVDIDHHVMKENAVFLLDLAPLNNSESVSVSPWDDTCTRSPPTPPGSVWQPAPPFQCLAALGAAPKTSSILDTARYHSLGRPLPPSAAPYITPFGTVEALIGSSRPRVHRSISMGQVGGMDLTNETRPPLPKNVQSNTHDTLSGAGSSLLSQPSAALQRLVGCGELNPGRTVSAFETPSFDPEALLRSPVLSFILARRELDAFRQKMDATVRINTVRQYALEGMNWLLRSATQPTCVHDVMWWFCTALEKFTRTVPPPPILDESKENAANENNRLLQATASASAICPGSRSARGARAAFHAFLGSVSALAPSLPLASAATLQAVRCWALNYSSEDRAFLHRSQMFSVISKILSHTEDGVYEELMLGALHESFQSLVNKENYVWTSPDMTSWCDVSVSSRQGMIGALTDGSTETFWESGEEDRNKAKWIQISYPGGTQEDRPHIVCVHVDNTRDTSNKTLLVSFLYSGGSSELFHMQDVEVDPKSAAWLCYTMPRVTSTSARVRCELRGPEGSVRVRQVRVFSAAVLHPNTACNPAQVIHALSETDTLKVFRLLTSQVFGKLLEWDRSGSELGSEGAVAAEDGAANVDSDLREHVVGILFAGHKLTSLQFQVMTHIVFAIGCETARVRDDWEMALICGEVTAEEPSDDGVASRIVTHRQDNYCFEMLSLLLALSGSAVGRVHLAHRTELLADLLALLHAGSERVQRQVISLLRRMVTEIPPQKMLTAINHSIDLNTSAKVSLLDHLVSYLGKAITVQVRVKGASGVPPSSVNMGTSVNPAPPAKWFMRGVTKKKHAHLVAKLLSDMAEDKISPAWGLETRTVLVTFVVQVAQVLESDRKPARCIAAPIMWMALAALCVCEQSHIELVNNAGDGGESRGRDSGAEVRPFCSNHDDDITVAVIDCRTCGPLCVECDRFLHLNRAAKTHHRQICKEEESAIRIDIHEGCGRAKLFWLLLLVDRRTLKGLAEFRGMDSGMADGSKGEEASMDIGPPGLVGTCRFCGARGNSGLLGIGNVCADQQCQDYGRDSCTRVLACSHLCGGVRGEVDCLPCLYGCATGAEATPLRQDADDMCMICFTDPLQAAPALQLKCGHVFHLHCCKKVLAKKWIGPRITFSFSQCPICKEDMDHWTLEEYLTPIKLLREEVKKKALMRLEYEGISTPENARGRVLLDSATYAMERYAYYVCHKCGKAYFGGLARCEVDTSGSWEPAELVCGACSDVTGACICPKHGSDFLEYKCRYCCSVAVFFCFGTSHFCNACHDDFQRVTNMPRHELPQCPAGPKCEQLPGTSEECPLFVQHPPTGEEFALGCGVCRHSRAF